eukprot:3102194-Amphidinium_carterae.1
MSKFRRSGTGNALTGEEVSKGPARGMLTRSGSKDLDIFKDLHSEIHPEDLAVAKSMQKGLSSHGLNRGMSKALEGGGGNESDEEFEQRMTPRKSKQEMVEQDCTLCPVGAMPPFAILSAFGRATGRPKHECTSQPTCQGICMSWNRVLCRVRLLHVVKGIVMTCSASVCTSAMRKPEVEL